MGVAHDINPVGIFRKEWQKHGEMPVAEYNPFIKHHFLREHITKQASVLFLQVFLRVVNHQLKLFRNKGIAVNLPMRMGHCNSDDIPAVFKYKDVLDILIHAKGLKAFNPKLHQLAYVGCRKLGQRDCMLWGIENHLAFAICGSGFKKIGGHRVGFGRILRKGRKIVVVFIYVIIIRNLARAGAERTPVLGHLGPALAM